MSEALRGAHIGIPEVPPPFGCLFLRRGLRFAPLIPLAHAARQRGGLCRWSCGAHLCDPGPRAPLPHPRWPLCSARGWACDTEASTLCSRTCRGPGQPPHPPCSSHASSDSMCQRAVVTGWSVATGCIYLGVELFMSAHTLHWTYQRFATRANLCVSDAGGACCLACQSFRHLNTFALAHGRFFAMYHPFLRALPSFAQEKVHEETSRRAHRGTRIPVSVCVSGYFICCIIIWSLEW